ncbi:MAG: hypothetical protein FJW56_10555 [Actinobacteria bacterium]|nr:hypothetical protein [Actinomycetota bacterium]
MTLNWQNVGIKKLAAIISEYLQKNNIEVVLVGGACVSIYSDNRYLSYDIDLITDSPIKKIIPVLEKLGFKNTGGRLFENPHCKFLIDFVAPPVSIGDEQLSEFNYLNTRFGTICLLTPTDCVKDRLAAYFFWNDLQSLDQAVIVAKRNKIYLSEIKKWAESQGEQKKYEIFVKRCK